MKKIIFISLSCISTIVSAHAATYQLTVTNGSAMPLSPSVVYTTRGQATDRMIGAKASDGFLKICRDGNAKARADELSGQSSVSSRQVVDGMIQPGESRTIMVKVRNPYQEVIHFETMYGKSRDICGVISVTPTAGSQQLTGRDHVVRTGAYLPPFLPENSDELCRDGDVVSCLRSLSPAAPGSIHFFRPYLPSVLSFLEERFGSEAVDTLLLPTSGAISYSLHKH